MRDRAVGRERAGWRRGGGGMMIALLLGVALMLGLMFYGFGNKSYMQNVAAGKKKGETVSIELQAASLVQMITTVRVSDSNAVPMTFEAMETTAAAFTDPWENPLRWEFDDDRRPTRVTVISDGPDGVADTEDDIRVEKVLPL